MNRRRKLVIALGALALGSPLGVHAQTKVWRLGYLDVGSRQSMVEQRNYDALIDGLRARGYIEGKNYVLEARFADGNMSRLDELAAELVRQKVDVMLSRGTQASHAAKRATSTIPIVLVSSTDPVGDKLVEKLARPGGNVTGMSIGNDETVQKLIELMMVAVPKMNRIAVLANPTNTAASALLVRVQAAAKKSGKQIVPVSARSTEEIERGFATMQHERVGGLVTT
jgi:putative ABC transport system substrate-binding protein